MNSSSSSPFSRRFLTTALSLSVALYLPAPVQAESSPDSAAASTVTSKQKVKVIIDRERTASQTVLLLKITVPEDAEVESFTLADPPRIVVDFKGVKVKTSENLTPPKNGVVKMIRLGAHSDKLRVVLDLSTSAIPQYDWRGGSRQATLRIVESTQGQAAPQPPAQQQQAPQQPSPQQPSAPQAPSQPQPTTQPVTQTGAAPSAVATIISTKAPTTAPSAAPTLAPTVAPSVAPTKPPTQAPTLTPTRQPTLAPTTPPTKIPTTPPTSTPAPVASPTPQATPATSSKTEPKLPDMSEKELEEALDKEVARATEALERGEKLPENLEFEGEDLVDVPAEEPEDQDLSEEKAPAAAPKGAADNKNAALITKDLPTSGNSQAPAKSDAVSGLKANPIPPPPVVDFSVQSAEYSYLEPDHKEAFRVSLSKPGAQAQMSKVDPTTYKIVIQKCGLANLGLALPQYPPADFKGILAVTPKIEGDTVEITAQVEQGAALTTLIRDREVWIKLR